MTRIIVKYQYYHYDFLYTGSDITPHLEQLRDRLKCVIKQKTCGNCFITYTKLSPQTYIFEKTNHNINRKAMLAKNGMYTRVMIIFIRKCLMLEVMKFCTLMTNITFFLLNITKTWRNHAPKKFYDSLKCHI